MNRKRSVKPMYSLKKKFGSDHEPTDDPIIAAWRRINRTTAKLELAERMVLLTATLPPYNGQLVMDARNEPPPDFMERLNELRAHLEENGELTSEDVLREIEFLSRADQES